MSLFVRQSIPVLFLCLNLVAVGIASAETPPLPWSGSYQVAVIENPSVLEGRVELTEGARKLRRLRVSTDRKSCGAKSVPNETLLVSPDGGLANCIVALEKAREGKAPLVAGSPFLDQDGCRFVPHVLTAMVGDTLIIGNSDPVFHNVHAYSNPGYYTRFNVSLPNRGFQLKERLRRPEILELRCDAGHRWMSGYVYVAPNPYFALTGEDGRFRIEGVPPGQHEIRIWHERIGELLVKATLPESGRLTARVLARSQDPPGFEWRTDPGSGSSSATLPQTSSEGVIR